MDTYTFIDIFKVLYAKKLGGLVGSYGISNFVGYLTPNPFLCN